MGHCGNRQRAAAHGLPGDVHRTGAASRNPATIFGARQMELITKDPEQGHVGLDVELVSLAVHHQAYLHVVGSLMEGAKAGYGSGGTHFVEARHAYISTYVELCVKSCIHVPD
jgi:hypothetical protein